MAPVANKGSWLTTKVSVRIHIVYLWYIRPYGLVTLVQTASSHMAANIWQQVHKVMHPRRQVHGGKYIMWQQVYGGKYMAARSQGPSQQIQAASLGKKLSRPQHGGKHMAARSQGPSQQLQAASLGRKLSRLQPLATGSWQQGSNCWTIT